MLSLDDGYSEYGGGMVGVGVSDPAKGRFRRKISFSRCGQFWVMLGFVFWPFAGCAVQLLVVFRLCFTLVLVAR